MVPTEERLARRETFAKRFASGLAKLRRKWAELRAASGRRYQGRRYHHHMGSRGAGELRLVVMQASILPSVLQQVRGAHAHRAPHRTPCVPCTLCVHRASTATAR